MEQIDFGENMSVKKRNKESIANAPNDQEYFQYGGFSNAKAANYHSTTFPLRRYSILMSSPGLRQQFENYARGEHGASGDFITMDQAEKWLKLAGIIDHWNVTLNDATYFFKKISRSV